MTSLEADINKKESELNALKEKLKHLNSLDSDKKLATILHEKQCKYNHVDGCSWYYRENDWSDSTHKEYLEKARCILGIVSFEKAERIVNVL